MRVSTLPRANIFGPSAVSWEAARVLVDFNGRVMQ
jgi:hypothetical protein